MTVVLDASALLAYLQNESGQEKVEAVLATAVISSVNWAEVVQKSVAAGVDTAGMQHDVIALGLSIQPFTADDADYTGQLWPQTRPFGLSLGDRACLGLGIKLQAQVLTADRIWTELKLPITIQSLR